jgi:hypothetical protein
LNNEGGERRLNVLITRAKMRCEVFTNITSEDIKVTESSRFGIRALKSFLYFAQFAKFDHPDDNLVTRARPFEEEVGTQLTKAGYVVRNKIGSPGFYLDLAVLDPENPGRYILGIACDGQSYASAGSATDRDRLRNQVLQLFGWNIYRVWSTDWYRNPERELQRLIAAIEEAITITQSFDADSKIFTAEIKREHTQAIDSKTPEYQLAEVHIEQPQPEFHLYTFQQLGDWINEVVKVESPVHADEVLKRITEAAGLSKAGNRIRYTFDQALLATHNIIRKGDFLWDPDMDQPTVRDRSKLPAAYKKLALIAPEEIYMAIQQMVEASIAITEEALIPLVARQLGFPRVTGDMRQSLSEAIGKTIQLDMITHEGLNLKSKN